MSDLVTSDLVTSDLVMSDPAECATQSTHVHAGTNVVALPTTYCPPASQESPEVETWLWWFDHVRARIHETFLMDLAMFPCRVGDKPGFLVDFDLSDREHMFMVRVALAAAIPEHASDVVFVRLNRSDARDAIDLGIGQLYAAAS